MGLMDLYIKDKNCYIDENLRKFFVSTPSFKKLKDKNAEDIAIELMKLFEDFKFDICGYHNEKNIKQCCDRYRTLSGGCKTSSDKNIFTATVNDNGEWYTKEEDNIERMIKLAFKRINKNVICENQIAIPDTAQSSHFDLLKKYDKTIEIVELKKWENEANPPTWAVAESIKNLYMFLHLSNHLHSDKTFSCYEQINAFKKKLKEEIHLYDIDNIDTFKLVVLAPKEYYVNCGIYENSELINAFRKFCKILKTSIQKDLVKKLKKTYKIEIKVLYINNFSKEVYKGIKDSIIKDFLSTNTPNKHVLKRKSGDFETEQTDEINLFNYINNNQIFTDDICNNLTQWKELLSV